MTPVGTSRYSYRVIEDFLKFPPGMPRTAIGCVATDSQDRVYIGQRQATLAAPDVDLGGPPVVVFDREGKFLNSWGNGAIFHAHGMHIANDVIYLVDKYSSVCIMYTLDGKPIQMLGRHRAHSDTGAVNNGPVPRPAGPFNQPAKLVTSPWGDLYAADGHANARVHRFDSGGHLIQSWGTYGNTDPGQFRRPHSVLATRDGRVYVCDQDNSRVQVFAANGEFIAMWTDMDTPTDIAQTPEGDFAISEQGPHMPSDDLRQYRISILDRGGKVLARLPARGSHGICVDSRGDIYQVAVRLGLASLDKYVHEDGRHMQ